MGLAASNLTSGGQNSAATSFSTASISPSVGNLLLVLVWNTQASGGAAGKVDVPGISGDGITFNLLATKNGAQNGANRLSVFWAIVPGGVSSGALTISFSVSQTRCGWAVDSISGIDSTTSISWCVQAGINGALSGSTAPTVTLASAQDSSSLFWGGAETGATTANTAPGSGWTQLSEQSTSANTLSTIYKVNDNVVTWTTTSAGYDAFGVEITASNSGARNSPLQHHDLACTGVGV